MGRKKKYREEPGPVEVEQVPNATPEAEIEIPLPPAPAPEFKRIFRFVSNFYPNLGMGFKGVMHNFQRGVLETDDPDFAKALEEHPWFGINYHRG